MARFELINDDGVICNVIVLDDDANWTPPKGLRLVAEGTGKGPAPMPHVSVPWNATDALELTQSQDFASIIATFPNARLRADTVVLSSRYGSIAFEPKGDGAYRCLLAVDNKYRRQGFALKMLNSCFHWMFNNTDATLIVGEIDVRNRNSLRIVQAAKGVEVICDPMANTITATCTRERFNGNG